MAKAEELSLVDKLEAVRQFANAIAAGVDRNSRTQGARERRSAKALLRIVLGREPTEQEIQSAMPW